MSIIDSLSRWIFASITTHFEENRSTLQFLFEGQNTDPSNNSMELRTNGPKYMQHHSNFWNVEIIINILVQGVSSDTDFHTIYKNVDIVVGAFEKSINIYKYGVESGDDDSLLGCLQRSEEVQVHSFGLVDREAKLMQSTVEATYKMEFKNGSN